MSTIFEYLKQTLEFIFSVTIITAPVNIQATLIFKIIFFFVWNVGHRTSDVSHF
jgi:hypothetical protein